jgi:hypothetical protein
LIAFASTDALDARCARGFKFCLIRFVRILYTTDNEA